MGGLEEIDLTDSAEEEVVAGPEEDIIAGPEEEVAGPEDEEENEEAEEAQETDKAACPATACFYRAFSRGERQRAALLAHIQKTHGPLASELTKCVNERFQRKRKWKTPCDFICDQCGQEVRGNQCHRKRHLSSCREKQ